MTTIYLGMREVYAVGLDNNQDIVLQRLIPKTTYLSNCRILLLQTAEGD